MSGPSAEPEKCPTCGHWPWKIGTFPDGPDCCGFHGCGCKHAAHSTPPAPATAEDWNRIDATIGAAAPAVAPTPQRTDADYAIEHGEYLAKAAEHLMDEINKYDMAESAGEDTDCDARSDAWNSLRSAIGEFRRRAKRALAGGAVAETPQRWTEKEQAVIKELCTKLDFSEHALMRQGLRICQLLQNGKHELREINPELKLAAPQPSDERAAFEKFIVGRFGVQNANRYDCTGGDYIDLRTQQFYVVWLGGSRLTGETGEKTMGGTLSNCRCTKSETPAGFVCERCGGLVVNHTAERAKKMADRICRELRDNPDIKQIRATCYIYLAQEREAMRASLERKP